MRRLLDASPVVVAVGAPLAGPALPAAAHGAAVMGPTASELSVSDGTELAA
jgi:hypothetical protein